MSGPKSMKREDVAAWLADVQRSTGCSPGPMGDPIRLAQADAVLALVREKVLAAVDLAREYEWDYEDSWSFTHQPSDVLGRVMGDSV